MSTEQLRAGAPGRGSASPRREVTAEARVVMRSHNLEEARALGTRLYYPHHLTPLVRPADFTFSATAACLGAVTAGMLRYSSAVRIDTDPYVTSYQVNVPLMGSLRTAVGDERVIATHARAALYTPDVPTAISGWERPSVMLAIKLDRRRVDHARRREAGEERPGRLGTILDVSQGAGRAWIACVRSMIAAVGRMPELDPGLAQFLSGRCIDGFVAVTSGDQELREPGSPDAAIVDRALEAIVYTSGPPLSLGDLATYVGMSARSIQSAFRRVLDETPMQVQRRERLRRVRHDLLSADPGAAQVAAVALRHGFTHMGRFSGQYQREFGELPSRTLGR